MADTEPQPTSHQLVQILEEEHRPGGAWIYHADPHWSPSAAVVFPERILLRITPAAGNAGYVWGVEEWDGRDQTYRPVRDGTGSAGTPAEMIGIASSFIDEENIGEPAPVTAYPLAEELGERIHAGYPDARWRYFVNSAYGSVLEYPGRRRLTFWDEANVMGSIDGYTWVMEVWSARQQSWVEVEPLSEVLSITELRAVISTFHAETERDLAYERTDTTNGPAPSVGGLARDAGRASHLATRLTEQLAERAEDLDPSTAATDAQRSAPAARRLGL
ncbi:hypothetical protein ACYX8G_02020 [Microbacterium saperdae]